MEEWIDRDMYPFSHHWLTLPPGTMHYVDEGEGGPVVMLHGNPTWSFVYRNLIRSLSPAYRCIAPDLFGFGLSDKPPCWSYRPNDHAQNITHLIKHLNLDNICLVVHDWGGPIGLSYAIRNPDTIRAMIVLNTWMWPVSGFSRPALFSHFMANTAGRILAERLNFVARGIVPLGFADPSKLTPRIFRHYQRPLNQPEKRIGTRIFPEAILDSKGWLQQLWEKRCRLKGIPKLLVWGMRDLAFDRETLQKWKKAFPEARISKIKKSGHFVQEEAPEELSKRAEQFLRDL